MHHEHPADAVRLAYASFGCLAHILLACALRHHCLTFHANVLTPQQVPHLVVDRGMHLQNALKSRLDAAEEALAVARAEAAAAQRAPAVPAQGGAEGAAFWGEMKKIINNKISIAVESSLKHFQDQIMEQTRTEAAVVAAAAASGGAPTAGVSAALRGLGKQMLALAGADAAATLGADGAHFLQQVTQFESAAGTKSGSATHSDDSGDNAAEPLAATVSTAAAHGGGAQAHTDDLPAAAAAQTAANGARAGTVGAEGAARSAKQPAMSLKRMRPGTVASPGAPPSLQLRLTRRCCTLCWTASLKVPSNR